MAGSSASPQWVHPLIWAFVGVFVLWAGFMQIVSWMEQVTYNGDPLIEYLRGEVEMKERPIDLTDDEYDTILAAGRLTPEKSHHGPPGGALYKVPQLYAMSARGDTILLFLSYHMVFFVMGVAGWACYYYLQPPASVWRANNRVRAFFSRPAIPLQAWASWFSNTSIGELLVYLVLIVLPKITMAITRFEERKEKWDAGKVSSVNALEEFNEQQFWTREVAFWMGIDWLIQLPVLFAFAARGSLLNTYLGVKYGTMLKWHRWLGVITLAELIMHGFLYQVLWWSDGWGTWVTEMKRFDMGHVSNLPGAVSWGAAVLMAAFAWPIVRRKAYRLFYYSHVFGALIFMIFGIMHHSHTWTYAAAGLVIYGIDLAYRVWQTSLPVTVDVSSDPSNRVISIRVPVKSSVDYRDGCHIWLSIPRLDHYDYHPLSVTSTPACPEWRGTMLLQCKVYDKWTQKLADAAAAGYFAGPVDAKIQGPYDGHNMAGYEMDTYNRKLFLSGGVGIAAVLPILKRMALHIQQSRRTGGTVEASKVVVVHSARTAADLMLAAPLLQHTDVFDLRLYYTGDPSGLLPAQKTLAAPLAHDGYPRSKELMSGKDLEAGSSDGGRSSPSFFALSAVPGKWESLFVWTMSWFFSFWTLIMAEMWYDSALQSQANALSKQAKYDRKDYRMAWMIFAASLTVPFVPFGLVTMWRIGKRLLVVRGSDMGSDSSGVGNVADAKQDSISMPGAPAAAAMAGQNLHADVASLAASGGLTTLSLNSISSSQVSVNHGRPDMPGAVKEVAASLGGGCMGVWSAGPKTMSNIIYAAVGQTGGDIRLFPLAYEM